MMRHSIKMLGFVQRRTPSRSFIVPKHRQQRLRGGLQRQSQSFFFSTYYDSQSSLHVPVHKEDEITLILNNAAQLYKEDASASSNIVSDKLLQDLKAKLGIGGVILPPATSMQNLETLSHNVPPGFMFFWSMPNNTNITQPPSNMPNFSALLNYDAFSSNDLEKIMKEHVDKGIKTTISIGEKTFNNNNNNEPIMIANRIAHLIDVTGGGDFLRIHTSTSEEPMSDTIPQAATTTTTTTTSEVVVVDADDVVRLCEELVYLDVAGPTVKSRMVVDATDAEIVEEVMLSGVNKFVVDNEDEIKIVEDIAEEQGKAIIVLR